MRTLIKQYIDHNNNNVSLYLIGYVNYIDYNSEGKSTTQWILNKKGLSKYKEGKVYDTIEQAKKQAKKLQCNFNEQIKQREYFLYEYR